MNIQELENLRVYNPTDREVGSSVGLSAYAQKDLANWREWLNQGDLSGITIVTLHSVGNDPTPLRWPVSIIQPARLVESLREVNITPPSRWKTMAPVNINAWVNSLDSQSPKQHAKELHNLEVEYLKLFHPDVPLPELEIDNDNWAAEVSRRGGELFHQLPEAVRVDLENMAAKHRNGLTPEEDGGAAYLLSHFNAYGHIEMPNGFPTRRDTVFILPASEHRFFSMMDQLIDTVGNIGLGPVSSLAERNCVVLVSDVLRTPHYYPHAGEPTLESIARELNPRWPTKQSIFEGRINGWAKQEVAHALAVINQDLGGTQNPQYSRRLKKVLAITKEALLES